jgi:hypothetical protein
LTELYTLLILLVVICLSECLCYVPEGTFAFRLFHKRSAKPAQPLFRLGSLGLEVFWGSSIPGRGELGFCDSEHRLSPLGICTCGPSEHHDAAGYLAFSDFADLKADGTKILAGSTRIAQTSSAIRATELVELLLRLKTLEPEARSIAIRKEFRRMLDVHAVRNRWSRFNRVTRWLDWNARLLLFVMLLGLPATIWFAGWRQAFPVAALCLALCIRQSVVFVRIDRVFQKRYVAERRTRVVSMTLSPPAAVRVRDYLSRDLFAAFHPFAVARATADEMTSHHFTARELRRLVYPADFEKHNTLCPVAVWFDREWRDAVHEWTRREFRHPASLLEPPAQQNSASLSYCPRCLEEFVLDRTECPDCPGVSLKTFNVERQHSMAN